MQDSITHEALEALSKKATQGEAMTNPRQVLEEAFRVIYPRVLGKGYNQWEDKLVRFLRFLNAEAWTDAALMLVPEGWRIIGLHETGADNAPAFEAFLGRRNGRGMSVYGNAAHPALALAQACLKARENSDG